MIEQKAMELNEALRQSAEYRELSRARAALSQDPQAITLQEEYRASRAALMELLNQDKPDREDLATRNDDMERAWQAMMDSPAFTALTQAQAAFRGLVNQVNGLMLEGLLDTTASSGCPGNCSNCGGCQ